MKKKPIELPAIITSCISAWCLTGTAAVLKNPYNYTELEFMREQNFALFLSVFVITAAVFFLIALKTEGLDKLVLLITSFLYAFACIVKSPNINIYIGFILLMAAVVYYVSDSVFTAWLLSNRSTFMLLGILALFFIAFVGGITAVRYLTYSTPGFDFGIFAQMFNYMKEIGIPYTTCERNILLSHFEIHLSPIYYLMLPFYILFPSPITLQILQAVIVASGIIPLYLLCRHYRFTNKMIVAAAACYAFYPGLSSACFYDLHENCFLAPLILWLIYMLEKDRKWMIWVFAVLVLLVKEDAPVYVATIGLYFWISGRSKKKGVALLITSIVYFGLAVFILSNFGRGVMTDRFDNYMFEKGGILTVIKSIILNPAYALAQITQRDKLDFAMQMLIPLSFLPLINKRFSQYILLIPFLVINMMPAYVYQHSIGYQYTFGTGVLFFYLFIINISGMKARIRRTILLFCTVATVLLFAGTTLEGGFYLKYYNESRESFDTISECLDKIPEEASVAASRFLIAHLYEHDELYQLPYEKETDYAVFDLRDGKDDEYLESYETDAYEKVEHVEGLIAVFKSKY